MVVSGLLSKRTSFITQKEFLNAPFCKKENKCTKRAIMLPLNLENLILDATEFPKMHVK